MSNPKPYTLSEINTLINDVGSVSTNSYKLFAAYALSNLYDTIDDEDIKANDMWGTCIPKIVLDRLVRDIIDDFADALHNYKPITIWGRKYAIRNSKSIDLSELGKIFNFTLCGDDYVVLEDGILNLESDETLDEYELSKKIAHENRIYLRQVIMLAEDDVHNGWDKLTDMEIAMYCWAKYCTGHSVINWSEFLLKYKDYIYVSERDLTGCYTLKSSEKRPSGMYCFSKDRVQEWNLRNKQRSKAIEIPPDEAENYWYDVALKQSFKPIAK